MSFYVYIIKSAIDLSFYKGFTQNYIARLNQHNEGWSKYTSRKIPWTLVYVEVYEDKKSALAREKSLKKYGHKQIEALIITSKNI